MQMVIQKGLDFLWKLHYVNGLPRSIFRRLLKSMWLPRIFYGVRVWVSQLSKANWLELDKLLRKAILVVIGCYSTTSYIALFMLIGLLDAANLAYLHGVGVV